MCLLFIPGTHGLWSILGTEAWETFLWSWVVSNPFPLCGATCPAFCISFFKFSPKGQKPCHLRHQVMVSQKEQEPLPQGYDQFYQRGLIFSHPTFNALGISISNEKNSVSNKHKIQKLMCPILECVGRQKGIYCEVPVIGKDTK